MLHLLLQLSWLCPWDRELQIPAWHRAGAAAELCLYSHFVNTLAQISGDFFFSSFFTQQRKLSRGDAKCSTSEF